MLGNKVEAPQENFFLGRQPILDRNQEIMGFELLFRSADMDHAEFESYSHASASVITNALATFGIHELLGGKFGFLNIHLNLLFSEVLELLPLQHTVLELLEVIELDQEVVDRCRELKELGFRLALDDHIYNPDYAEIYSVVDIVKIDILQTDAAQLPAIVKEFRRFPVKILAEKVETVEQFESCFAMGFDLFQGYFFARPVVLNKRRIDVSGIAMLKLLQQLSVEAGFSEIEQTFKENPGLSYNLLRLVNSVALGIREKIKTLRHAIVILGMNHLRRWVQLALFAGNDTRGVNNPLLEMAAVRGILMELLVVQKGLSSEQAEEAFMTGILSLLDVLFEMDMSNVVESLNLTDEVSNALLDRQGQLGCLLHLVERIELTDFDAVKPLLSQCGITLDQLFAAQLEAFNWRATIMED